MADRLGPAAAAVTAGRLMAGAPPFPAAAQVTLANWQDPPFNRWAFQHVRELIPSARIAGASEAQPLPRDERPLGRLTFSVRGTELTVDEFLNGSYTDGFLVVHRGRVVTERYFNGMQPQTPHLLMSVSKSVTSAVAGILAGRGVLDPAAEVSTIVPELASTSFAGATVQHLLDMRAGTRFNEDYADLDADVRSYERVYLWRPPASQQAGGADATDAIGYFATLVNDGPHGGPFRYRSILTDVLAWAIERAAGERLHELISRELWQPMGAEYDAEITIDRHGNPMADGGVSATLRDLARFGLLYLYRGQAGDRRVVPSAWVDDTVRGAPDGPRAFAEGDDRAGYPDGGHYRNCWWVREPALPFYHGSGINGQGVFVHGLSETVVAKMSTWPVAWSDELYEQTIACVQAITSALADG